MRAYPEVSTLSQKQIHFFVIGCCPLGSSFLPSLCSTCSVSATVRSIPDTDLLAPHVGHLLAAVWFSGSTKKLTGRKFRWLIRVTARNCWCFCLLVGNSINFPEVCHILKTAIQITWHVAYKRHNLSAISKVVVPSTSVQWWFCKLSPCFHLCDLWRTSLNVQNLWTVSLFDLRKPLRSLCSPHGIDTESCFENFIHFHWCSCEFEAKLFKCVCSPIHTQNIEHPLRSSTGLWLQNLLDWLKKVMILWCVVIKSCTAFYP